MSENFKADPQEANMISLFNTLSIECHSASIIKGFWNDYEKLQDMVHIFGEGEYKQKLSKALEGMMIGQKIALIHSELSEGLEGSRKDLESDKLPGFTAEEEELADAFIRGFDLAGKRKMRLGLAIVMKLRYNAGRPYMHGKNF